MQASICKLGPVMGKQFCSLSCWAQLDWVHDAKWVRGQCVFRSFLRFWQIVAAGSFVGMMLGCRSPTESTATMWSALVVESRANGCHQCLIETSPWVYQCRPGSPTWQLEKEQRQQPDWPQHPDVDGGAEQQQQQEQAWQQQPAWMPSWKQPASHQQQPPMGESEEQQKEREREEADGQQRPSAEAEDEHQKQTQAEPEREPEQTEQPWKEPDKRPLDQEELDRTVAEELAVRAWVDLRTSAVSSDLCLEVPLLAIFSRFHPCLVLSSSLQAR